MTWILFDFAGVLGLHQSEAAKREIVEAAAVCDAESFWDAYWQHRQPYDAGLISAGDYWTRLGVRGVGPAAESIDNLVRLDVASWLRPNIGLLDLITDLRELGFRLAVLSNAPPELAAAIAQLTWLKEFDELIFSCHLHRTKPDPRCFEDALKRLGAAADQVYFYDDRWENVVGAASVGLRSALFTDTGTVQRLLRGRQG